MSKRLSDDEKRVFSDQISLLKNENERLTEHIELLERGFTYVSENGRELLVRMWNDEPWIFYKHPDGQWVSLQKCDIAEELVLAKG